MLLKKTQLLSKMIVKKWDMAIQIIISPYNNNKNKKKNNMKKKRTPSMHKVQQTMRRKNPIVKMDSFLVYLNKSMCHPCLIIGTSFPYLSRLSFIYYWDVYSIKIGFINFPMDRLFFLIVFLYSILYNNIKNCILQWRKEIRNSQVN